MQRLWNTALDILGLFVLIALIVTAAFHFILSVIIMKIDYENILLFVAAAIFVLWRARRYGWL